MTDQDLPDFGEVATRIVRAYISAMETPPFIRRKRIVNWACSAGFSEDHADLVPDFYALLAQNKVQRDNALLRAIEEYVSPDGRGGYIQYSDSTRNALYAFSPEKYSSPHPEHQIESMIEEA